MAERVAPSGPLRLGENRLNRGDKHELLNIFSSISANAEVVREEPGSAASMQRRVERIVSACRRGEALVQRVGHTAGPVRTESCAASGRAGSISGREPAFPAQSRTPGQGGGRRGQCPYLR